LKTGENKTPPRERGLKLGRVALMATLLSTSAFSHQSYANPEGGLVVGGSATITESGKKLDVYQHTHRTVIDWRSFNIDVDEHTQFHQPSNSAIVLNRVTSADPSQILGKLSANGNVVLVNPNGVFFGKDSVVDVNGLVATTADIDTNKFMAGSNHFDRPGNPNAAIVNIGTITAKETGLVGLVAPNVENHGVITAKMGRVQLASGDTVVADFYGDGLLKVEVTDENVTSQFVGNTGRLEAKGGTVAMTAAAARQTVNSLIVAKGELKAPTVSKHGGKIIIGAAGSNKTNKQGNSHVIVQASLDASGRDEGEQGGSIEVLGDHIAVLDSTVIDASGHSASMPEPKPDDGGSATMTAEKAVRPEDEFMEDPRHAGGSIKIGGDYLGQGDTQTAQTLYVGDYVLTLNDAIENGDAGRTIFWSDDTTDFNGLVFARGGINGGHGGFLETSGKINLRANGFADLTAQDGYKKGTYLLDPADITIYGNVDPTFVSTDASVDLAANLELWLDAADETAVTLTYSTDSLGGATANGTIGTNTITTSTDVSANLEVGARIRLGAAGVVGTADTLGTDTYTITNIAGTTITVQETLTATYAGDTLRRGLVSQWGDKSGNGLNATQATESKMALWISNDQNGSGTLLFDGINDSYNTGTIDLTGTDAVEIFTGLNNDLLGGTTTFFEFGTNFNGLNDGFYVSPQDNSCCGHNGVTASVKGNAGYSINAGITQIFDPSLYNFILDKSLTGPDETAINVNGAGYTLKFPPTHQNDNANNFGNHNLFLGARNNSSYFYKGAWFDALMFSDTLSLEERALVTQYQSAKWGIALTPPGSGADEASKAMASDGYGVFTTDYLERLSSTADIVLQATNTITLDLQGDTLALDNDRSISLTTTNGDIATASIGTIQTAGTGDITFTAGQDILFNHGLDLHALDTGNITLIADRNIDNSGGADFTTNGGHITLNADRDADGIGAIKMMGASITTNGGDFIAGGGLNPLTTAAKASQDGVYDIGVLINATNITTGAGDILIRGEGEDTGTRNEGVRIETNSTITTTSGDIFIYGQGGNGTNLNTGIIINDTNTLITSTDGDILLEGIGGNGTSSDNSGITLSGGADITSTGSGANAGTITLNGTGGDGTSSNHGIYLNGDTTTITSVDGDISLDGTGGINATSSSNTGIYFLAGADILSLGITADAAKITLNATAGRGNSTALHLNGGSIRSGYGDIEVSGIKGAGTTGGWGVFVSNHLSGVSEAIIASTGIGDDAADITVTGTGAGNNGVFLHVGGAVETVDGDINVTADGPGHLGALALRYDSWIKSTGVGANAGKITLSGTSASREGVGIHQYSYVSSIDGDISITGTGGNGTSLGYGILIGDQDGTSNGYILSQGAANITLNGMAGDCSTGACYGVYMDDATGTENYIRANGTGNIDITGRGGNTGSDNYGIFLKGGSYIESTATGADAGTITLNGTGGDGDDANHGVVVNNNGTQITSVDGAINITGQGGSNSTADSDNNFGIYIFNGAHIVSTGTGANAATITLHGTGGAGGDGNYGVRFSNNASNLIDSVDGDIVVTAQGQGFGSNNDDISFLLGTIRTTNDAEINLNINSVDMGGGFISSVNNLNITPRTSGTTIGLGGGAGTLNLSDVELAQFSVGGDLTIGSGTTGAVHIDSVDFTGITANTVNLFGDDFTIDGALAVDAALNLIAQGDMTLNGSVSANGAGNSIVMAGSTFINNGGAGALNPGLGRWLIYSADPGANTLGGLSGDFKRYNKTYAGYAPASVTETDDGFLYSIVPTLNVTADNKSRNFGQANPALTYSASGLIGGDTINTALNSLPILSTTANTNSVAGNYAINAGSLVSDLGYTINFTPGTLTVNPQMVLPSTWEGAAYANNGLGLDQSVIRQNTGFILSPPSQINFTIAPDRVGSVANEGNESNESSNSDQSSVRRAQTEQNRNNSQAHVIKVTIEAALARLLGLTQEKIDEMFQ